MALQFSETAPGVHTTTLTDPKTDRRHNVAIIESCNAWQLFIDGELRTRDLPSFKAAVAAAQSQVSARRSSSMVRVASALVVVSVAGAATIGLAKVISPLLGSETAIAEVASTTKGEEIPARFTRVRPPVKKEKPTEIAAQPKAPAPIEEVAVTVGEPISPTVLPEKAPEPPKTAQPVPPVKIATKPETTEIETPAIGLRPLSEPTLTETEPKQEAQPEKETVTFEELPTVVIKPKPAPRLSEQPAEESNEVAAGRSTPAETTPEPLPTVNDEEAAEPPLPVKAPVATAPLIRPVRAPIEPKQLRAILSDIEDEANETEVSPSFNPPAPAVAAIKKRAPKRKKSAHRSRRTKRSTHRQRRHTRRRSVRTARAFRHAPQPRMVCFAHSCRFR